MYLQILHKAHIEYCKMKWLEPVWYSSFSKKWAKVKNDFWNVITTWNQWYWRRCSNVQTLKEQWLEYANDTWDTISYTAYLWRIRWIKPVVDRSLERELHSIVNWVYATETSAIPRRINNVTKRNTSSIWQAIFLPRLSKYLNYNKLLLWIEEEWLDVNRYKYLNKIAVVNIHLVLKDSNQDAYTKLKFIWKQLQEEFYDKIIL